MRFRIETDPPLQISIEWVKGQDNSIVYNVQHFPASGNYAMNYWTLEELQELRRLLVALDVARERYESAVHADEIPFYEIPFYEIPF